MPQVKIIYVLEHKYLRSITYEIMSFFRSSPQKEIQAVRFGTPAPVTFIFKVHLTMDGAISKRTIFGRCWQNSRLFFRSQTIDTASHGKYSVTFLLLGKGKTNLGNETRKSKWQVALGHGRALFLVMITV